MVSFCIAMMLWINLLIPLDIEPRNYSEPPGPEFREVVGELTAYNENDGETPSTTMANGKQVHYGAVANDQLPLGTKVEIDGEIFVVSDRFGAGHPVERFDIYMESTDACEKFGRQKKIVRILEDG